MRSALARPGRARLAGIAGVALIGTMAMSAVTEALTQVLPDLRMSRPTDVRVTTSSSGRRLLRLTTTIVNVGRGRFELVAVRPNANTMIMQVQQRIWRNDGTTRYVTTNGSARYAGDGHDHWHIRRVASYDLVDSRGRAIRRDSKIGFCFFDTGVYDSGLPGYRPVKRYWESGCGGRSTLRATMGISVGWGDTYGSGLAYQWIDVTGVAAGTYWIVVTADKDNNYLESNEANNCSWAKVRLTSGATSVSTLSRGQGCTPPGVGPTPTPKPSPPPSASPSLLPSASPGP